MRFSAGKASLVVCVTRVLVYGFVAWEGLWEGLVVGLGEEGVVVCVVVEVYEDGWVFDDAFVEEVFVEGLLGV